jgi:hypothetical protein
LEFRTNFLKRGRNKEREREREREKERNPVDTSSF